MPIYILILSIDSCKYHVLQTRPDDNDDDYYNNYDNDDYDNNYDDDYDDYDDAYDGDYDVLNLSQLLMQNSHSLLLSSFEYTTYE